MDNITELAQLFAERNNPNDQIVFIADYLDGGKLRVRNNVVLQPGKYINAIPHCTCTHTCSTVSCGGYQASPHTHTINCDHNINIKPGDKCVVLRMGKTFIAIAKVRA